MGKTNGKDEEQAAEQPDEQESQQFAIAAVITVDPANGAMQLRPNDQIIKDRMKFFLALGQLALGNATTEHHKRNTSKILVPQRKVARL